MNKQEVKMIVASTHNPVQVGDKIIFEPIHTRKPHKLTLADVNEKVDKLYIIVAELSNKIDKLAMAMNDGFNKINARIDNLVKKNNLIE